ncbi:NAD-dependent epimerase/dehydratase family protein [Microcella sp.]|uniref:NAD-dependent epimerase/dehydratase family protein n=1 Tax=Microcella sp. TaxID=1913979 RepID=UPI003F6EB259
MKVLLLGASGYLARNLAPVLRAQGHELIQVFRTSSESAGRAERTEILYCAATDQIRDVISEVMPDAVINMANYFSKTHETSDVALLSDVNTNYVTEVALGCLRTGAVLIHIGSAWQASSFDEDDPSIGNVYGLFRGLAVRIIDWFRASFQLNALVINLYDTYGPGDSRGKIVQFLVNQVGSDEPLELSGGQQILELVHVDDVASAISAAIDLVAEWKLGNATLPDHHYWCYPSEATTLRNVVDEINAAVAAPIPVKWGARPYRVGEKFEREIDGKPRVPGWSPKVSLREGIRGLLSTD